MRTILTIVLLLIAMIAVKTSNANSQDACTPKYVSCIDTCVAKKGGQDQCIAACQQKNDTCAAGVFGIEFHIIRKAARPFHALNSAG